MPSTDSYQPRHAGRSIEVEPRLDLDDYQARHSADGVLVERVAVAIYRAEPGASFSPQWEDRGGLIRDSYREQARAVVVECLRAWVGPPTATRYTGHGLGHTYRPDVAL